MIISKYNLGTCMYDTEFDLNGIKTSLKTQLYGSILN